MPWTERQLAMLDAMGLRVWSQAPTGVGAQGTAVAVAAAPEPARPPAAAVAVGRKVTAAVAATGDHGISAPAAAGGIGPGAVAGLDWAALRRTVAGCTACRLCEGRRQTVFGVGHERAHWMIIGEAPGEQEDRQGEPFVGKSGQLLDNMLHAIGLSRHPGEGGPGGEAGVRGAVGEDSLGGAGAEDGPNGAAAAGDPARQVYLCNTLKCRPPGNRNPEPDELARCEAYLVRQIELVQPRIILAMGRFAVQSLLRSSDTVGRLRGRVHRYRDLPLVVTYHPAYLLRNPDDKARAWDDLCLAVEALQQQPPRAPDMPTGPTAPAAPPSALPAASRPVPA